MCDPITMTVLGIGMSAMSGIAGYESQEAQYQAQQKMYQQNQINAERAFSDTNRALNVQEEQQQAQAGTEQEQNDLKTRAAQSTAIAGAAAGGVQGISMEEILGDFSSKDAQANSAIQQQLTWNIAQAQNQKTAAADQEVSRINSVSPGTPPSPLSAALDIGKGVVSGLSNFNRISTMQGGGGIFGAPAGFSWGTGLSIPGVGA